MTGRVIFRHAGKRVLIEGLKSSDRLEVGEFFRCKRPNVLDGMDGWGFRGNAAWRKRTGEQPGNYPTWARTWTDLREDIAAAWEAGKD